MRRVHAEKFRDAMFPSGLTYSSHTLACQTALATIAVMEEDHLVERACERGRLMTSLTPSWRRSIRPWAPFDRSACSG
jgi:taurine--2-oxoglutarate transaminase